MNKKAQIRMVETISVLIIFMFLLFIGYSFYASIQQRNFQTQLREIQGKNAVQIALKTYFLPELHCSFGTGLETQGCIDIMKFEELASMLEDPNGNAYQYYFQIFGPSHIQLQHVYPIQQEETLFDASLNQEGVSSKQTQMPVSIYDPRTRTYTFGYLKMDFYFRT